MHLDRPPSRFCRIQVGRSWSIFRQHKFNVGDGLCWRSIFTIIIIEITMKLKMFQVDAFAEEVFKGNTAAVSPLDSWLDDSILQAIAEENILE